MMDQALHTIPGHSLSDENEGIDLRARIVDAARELFLTHGYSKVSTSEIAQAIGISKKTLYKEFETKEEILRAVIIPKVREASRLIDEIRKDKNLPFLEKLKTLMSTIGFQHQKVSHVLMRDVAVHAPEVWQEINLFRKKRFEKFAELLDEGVRSGFFRSDIAPEIVTRLFTSAVDSLMTPAVLGELPCTTQNVYESLLTILFEGIVKDDMRKEFRVPRTNTRGASKKPGKA